MSDIIYKIMKMRDVDDVLIYSVQEYLGSVLVLNHKSEDSQSDCGEYHLISKTLNNSYVFSMTISKFIYESLRLNF